MFNFLLPIVMGWLSIPRFLFRCKPDVETYNALINAHGRAGQWRWALNIMEDMLQAAVCVCIFHI